jgi:molecular chaperone DnaK (HSP70)
MMPILSDFAPPLYSFKEYIESKQIKLKSIELLGGASRIPFFQNMVSDIFKMDLSRTLNSSECIARGACIFTALSLGFTKEIGIQMGEYNFFDIVINANCVQKSGKLFKKNSKLYSRASSQVLFKKGDFNLPM